MPSVLAKERALYQKVYSDIPEYNSCSPCAALLPTVIDIANQHGVKSILDAGCGRGQSVHALDIGGFNVRGIDLTLNDSLKEIARVSARFAFLQICTRKDCFGKRVNATLHKSVHNSVWWSLLLSTYFNRTDILEEIGGNVIIFCQK